MSKLTIQLKNNRVELPDDVGNYVLSTGCGSGKTYWLRGFTLSHYSEGMLIVVDSIISAESLYKGLISLGLDEKNVMMIHSKTDFQIQADYANKPWEVTKKKVLIITNVRLYTEYPPAYLLYNSNGATLSPFNGDWGKLMANPDVRRWIIIDEIPGFIQKYITIPRVHLGVLGEDDGKGGYKAKDLVEMKKWYDKFIAHTDSEFFDTTTALGRLRTDTALSIINKEYTKLLKGKDNVSIQFSPCDFLSDKSLILIMEGAGDILFKDSKVYKLIDIPVKYRGKVKFQKINTSTLLKRKCRDQEEQIKSMVEAVLSVMSTTKGKTLITCWKDFKEDGEYDDLNKSELVNKLLERLEKTVVDKDSYSIIYYGSSESKAVNKYKDYSNIILLGYWSLSVTSSDKFKIAFHTDTTYTRYMLWEYVQLITRTAIRQDRDIRVFYTDDHKEEFISTLDKYFNKNKLDIPEEQIDWRSKIKEVKYGNRVLKTIEMLVQRFPSIPKYIVQGKKKTIQLSLKEINKLTGKVKKKRDYNHTTKVLKKLGITLVLD